MGDWSEAHFTAVLINNLFNFGPTCCGQRAGDGGELGGGWREESRGRLEEWYGSSRTQERTEPWEMRDWEEGGKAWINKPGAKVRLRGT